MDSGRNDVSNTRFTPPPPHGSDQPTIVDGHANALLRRVILHSVGVTPRTHRPLDCRPHHGGFDVTRVSRGDVTPPELPLLLELRRPRVTRLVRRSRVRTDQRGTSQRELVQVERVGDQGHVHGVPEGVVECRRPFFGIKGRGAAFPMSASCPVTGHHRGTLLVCTTKKSANRSNIERCVLEVIVVQVAVVTLLAPGPLIATLR
jgi:hypothetical protein